MRSFRLKSPEMVIEGVYAPSMRDEKTKVSILETGFHPRLDYSPTFVKQHEKTKSVVVPSISRFYRSGYEPDKVGLVTKIIVHPRHIRNRNFFRTEFPAYLKSVAKRYDMTLILTHADIASAYLVRKEVLNIWRGTFSPLLMGGKHFVSGSLYYFIIPNSPKVTEKIKKSLALSEGLTEGVASSSDEAIMFARALERELGPAIARRARLSRRYETDIESVISDPEYSADLLHSLEGQPRRLWSKKIKSWWIHKVVPQLKISLGYAGREALDKIVSLAFSIVVAAIVTKILTKEGKTIKAGGQDINLRPSSLYSYLFGMDVQVQPGEPARVKKRQAAPGPSKDQWKEITAHKKKVWAAAGGIKYSGKKPEFKVTGRARRSWMHK